MNARQNFARLPDFTAPPALTMDDLAVEIRKQARTPENLTKLVMAACGFSNEVKEADPDITDVRACLLDALKWSEQMEAHCANWVPGDAHARGVDRDGGPE